MIQVNVNLLPFIWAYLDAVKQIEIDPIKVGRVPKDAELNLGVDTNGYFVLTRQTEDAD